VFQQSFQNHPSLSRLGIHRHLLAIFRERPLLAIFSALAHTGSAKGRRGAVRAQLLFPRSSAEPPGHGRPGAVWAVAGGVGAKDLAVVEDREELPVAEVGEELARRDAEVRRDARVRGKSRRRSLGSSASWTRGAPPVAVPSASSSPSQWGSRDPSSRTTQEAAETGGKGCGGRERRWRKWRAA
jgi:hypothetical protein